MIPQNHRSKWTQEEDTFIIECISKNQTLDKIQQIISLRTAEAVLKRTNDLGFGHYKNTNDGLTYFREEIKHKKRSCKNNSNPTKKVATTSSEDTDSVPKTVDDTAYYAGSLAFMLRGMKENRCLHL